MINKNTKNIFAKEYIFAKAENYEEIFRNFGIVTLEDLELRINDGTIKDKFLENMLEEKSLGIGLELKEISTDSLRFDPKVSIILDEFELDNFEQLEVFINALENKKQEVNPLIKGAYALAKGFIEKTNNRTR